MSSPGLTTPEITYRTDSNGTLDEATVATGLLFSSRLIDYQRLNGLGADSLAQYMLDPDNGPLIAVTAHKDEYIVGFGVAHPRYSRVDRNAHTSYIIDSLAVTKENRRQGVASTILDELESRAASLDSTTFVVETLSQTAIAFYERQGYRRPDIAKQTGFVVMRKTVGPKSRPKTSSRARR